MYKLSCLNQEQTGENYLVSFEIKKNPLTFVFNIQSKLEIPNISPTKGKSIWGLWDFDVIELFIQPRIECLNENAPYWEFQVSPTNQQFLLEVTKPRISYSTPLDLEWRSSASIEERNWSAKIVLTDIRFQELENLYFGCFAILGHENRHYFSYRPNDETVDFHRPQFFHKL